MAGNIIISLARQRGRRAKLLIAAVPGMIEQHNDELDNLIEHITERGMSLLRLAHKLPEGSDAQWVVENAAQVWLDMAHVAIGGDPVGQRREIAEKISGAGGRQ